MAQRFFSQKAGHAQRHHKLRDKNLLESLLIPRTLLNLPKVGFQAGNHIRDLARAGQQRITELLEIQKLLAQTIELPVWGL